MKKVLNIIIILCLATCQNFIYAQGKTEQSEVLDSNQIMNEFNLTFSIGGESKLALFFPKIEYLRIHQAGSINLFYGASLGIHGSFVTGYGSLSAIVGIEKDFLDLSSSISHFRTLKTKIDNNETNGPFIQNLLNLKIGFRMKNTRIRIGTSFILNETVPINQERIPFLDIGKINGRIWLFEIQTILNRN